MQKSQGSDSELGLPVFIVLLFRLHLFSQYLFRLTRLVFLIFLLLRKYFFPFGVYIQVSLFRMSQNKYRYQDKYCYLKEVRTCNACCKLYRYFLDIPFIKYFCVMNMCCNKAFIKINGMFVWSFFIILLIINSALDYFEDSLLHRGLFHLSGRLVNGEN